MRRRTDDRMQNNWRLISRQKLYIRECSWAFIKIYYVDWKLWVVLNIQSSEGHQQISFFSIFFNLFWTAMNESNYQTVSKNKRILLWSRFNWPIRLAQWKSRRFTVGHVESSK
jgi:hypothetical protein